MPRYFLFLFLLLSCNSGQKEDATASDQKNETIAIPGFVKEYLKWQLPKWTFPPIPKQDIARQTVDLNCDGTKDFVGIFRDSIGNNVLMEIVSLEETYIDSQLENFGKIDPLQIKFSLLSTYRRYDSSIQVFDCGAVEASDVKAEFSKIYFRDSIGRSNIIEYRK